jgi:hypothetical protein
MSQVTQSKLAAPLLARPIRVVAAGASLLALAAVGLALSVSTPGQSAADAVSLPAAPSLRTDGGPEESHVAASAGSRAAPAPDESRIAASIAAR